MRHELKFVLSVQDLPRLQDWLTTHAWWQRAYPDRTVTSMYFDTADLRAAQDHLDGVSGRVKHRIRWYTGDSGGARYEIKSKRASLGTKHVRPCPLDPEELLRQRTLQIQHRVSREPTARQMGGFPVLLPSLVVAYRRSYFTAFGELRLTIDQELTFLDLSSSAHLRGRQARDELLVVEIKAAPEQRDYLAGCLSRFPLTRVRRSKYVLGLSHFDRVSYL